MKVRVAVPRRSDGGHRDALWDFCRRYWRDEFPDFEVVEGHHTEGPFNRSAAINMAALGEWDVLIVADSDIAAEPGPVRSAVAACTDGRMHLPYQRRMLVDARGTERILRGYVGNWSRFASPDPNVNHCSSVVVTHRDLWERVGGFDERFEGWGAEDDAFMWACESVAGEPVRHDGHVWHLWHPPSPHRNHRSLYYIAACSLLERYKDPEQVARVIAEKRTPDGFAVVVLTTGERPELVDTITSINEQVRGDITRKLICVDGVTLPRFDGWETVQVSKGRGYCKAMAAARYVALGSGQPWVFWSEDDFLFDRPVDLCELRDEMKRYPDLVQLSLLRQAWYKPEIEAGGVVETDPEAFERRGSHLAHRKYWTQNPHLVRRMTLAEEWPQRSQSEWAFAERVLKPSKAKCGVWGDGEPWVTHIGEKRAGRGY